MVIKNLYKYRFFPSSKICSSCHFVVSTLSASRNALLMKSPLSVVGFYKRGLKSITALAAIVYSRPYCNCRIKKPKLNN
jgi:hypothetical protein